MKRRRLWLLVVSSLLALGGVPSAAGAATDPVLAAAGDIACPTTQPFARKSCHQASTAALVRGINPTAVAVLGDNQYESGALPDYLTSFDPTWGAFKGVMRPTSGNHEYVTPGATGYYQYFGPAAGDPTRGYYSYDLGSWHVVVLNSNCRSVPCTTGSAQEQWLRSDLATHSRSCSMAYWHHTLFSSQGGDPRMGDIWQTLRLANVDVVLSGHNHVYERFAPQDAAGVPDPERGPREFVVGTGGKSLGLIRQVRANTEAHDTESFGVLAMTLGSRGYSWRFVTEDRGDTDAGTAACHDHTPAALRSLRIAPPRFTSAKRGASLAAAVGGTLRYRLSEPASTSFAVLAARGGRRHGTRCLPVRHPVARRNRCTLWVPLPGTFTRPSAGGHQRVRFSGRLAARRLAPGRYQLVATTTDLVGNVGDPARVGFEITR
jgi:hypothetical protein